MTDREVVCIAVCTFRREAELAHLIERLGELRFDTEPPALELLVIDNAPEGGAEHLVRPPDGRYRAARYVHLGASNIASARNAVLDHLPPDATLVATIDDDEEPEPRWLAELMRIRAETGAAFVVGPVRPSLPADAPDWIREGGFFDLYDLPDAATMTEGLTGNALLEVETVRRLGLRFEEALGHSGGEDQLFFRQAVAAGASVRFAARAVAHERVPASRLSRRYLLRREYRKGNTLGLLDRGAPAWPDPRPVRRVVKAGVWTIRGLALLVSGSLRRDRARATHGALRLARAAGMVSGLIGRRFEAYGASSEAPVLVFVVNENPRAQAAGHNTWLQGFIDHYRRAGFLVVVLVRTTKLGFVVRRDRDGTSIRSGGSWRFGKLTVARPATATRELAWRVFVHAPRLLQRVVDHGRNRWRRDHAGYDHVLGRPLSAAERSWIRDEAAATGAAAVLVNTHFNAVPMAELPPQVRTLVVVADDVVSERAAAFSRLGYRTSPPTFGEAEDRAALAGVPNIVAIQWEDAARFEELAPHARVVVSPPSISASIQARRPMEGRCLFVGSGSLHNVDGLRWFLAEVWPEVRDRAPDASLHVVGTVCARIGEAPAGVRLRGQVEDLQAEYAAAQVAVVPLRAGSGLKVKLAEALVHGLAVVTTPVGAQGFAPDDRPFVVAANGERFAAAVVRLLEDRSARAALEAQAAVAARRFRPEEAFTGVDEVLRGAGVPWPRA